ncbi:MAG: flagellar basal body rod protein FlgC [Phycisphaeraceae bacterium]
MFGALDTSTSALVAQRTRAQAISANIANQNANFDANGENNPFQRRIAVLAPGDPSTGNPSGVHVREILLDPHFKEKYDPTNPTADERGYIKSTNVDPMMEQVNMLEASRAYEANIAAAEATKSMIQTSLRLLA